MTRVLITGGAGRVGRATTARFVEHGWDVRVIGIEPDVKLEGAEYVLCDINDYEALRKQVHGCQAIVHLAAIPAPSIMNSPEMFHINTAGTFNVFEAADAEGIGRIVQASSINAIGCAWNTTDIAPPYFPVDEEFPSVTNDAYSFSKKVVEDIGDYYWRRCGLSSVGLRLPAVYPAEHLSSKKFLQDREQMQYLLDTFAQVPEEERLKRLAAAAKKVVEFRGRRQMEYPAAAKGWSEPEGDWLVQAYHGGRFNFWAYIDDRDAAQAAEKALTADYEGSHPLFVVNAQNWVGYNSEKLLELFFPGVTVKRRIEGADSIISIEKAKTLIGYQSEYPIPE